LTIPPDRSHFSAMLSSPGVQSVGPKQHVRAALGASVRRLRPRAGVPPPRKFEDSRSVYRFEAISSTLCASGVPADACSSPELGRLTGRLLLFADTSLGRDVPFEERVQGVTKLPSRIIADFSRDGPLACILRAHIEFKNAKGWDVIYLRHNERRCQHIEMIRVAERALRAAKFYPPIKVLFSATLPAEKEIKLRELVHVHGAAVVSSPDVASHVV
jgi:SWIRM-associated domain at the N-terminal